MFDELPGVKDRGELISNASRPRKSSPPAKFEDKTEEVSLDAFLAPAEIAPICSGECLTPLPRTRECQGGYALTRTDLGGGFGTLSMVMRGCLRSERGTDPMAERVTVGRPDVRQDVSVHAPPQPAIAAQALKVMPIGPKKTQRMTTMPATQRRRVKPIALPLSRGGWKEFSPTFNIAQNGAARHADQPRQQPQNVLGSPASRRGCVAQTPTARTVARLQYVRAHRPDTQWLGFSRMTAPLSRWSCRFRASPDD
jgi:hypothetical protein